MFYTSLKKNITKNMIWIIFLFFINASGFAEYDNICTYQKPEHDICKIKEAGFRAG